jgi:DNA-binding transcriptional LysR family regulator
MTIRHLKVFITVAELGSMTKAAEKLYISQPSVSQTIAELENHYQLKLFERLSRKLYLTAHGKQLLSYARHIVSLFNQMEQKLKRAQTSSTLKIGASITVGICILSELAGKFLQKYPKLKIESVVDNTTVIEELVLKSELDFALVEGLIHSQDIIAKPFCDDELILISGAQHHLSTKVQITIDELAQENLILRESGSGTRELFENTMLAKGKSLKIGWVCNNSEAIKNAVASNMGVSVISKLAVENELKTGRLVQIDVEGLKLKRQFCIIYHKNKYISKQMKDFWRFCFAGED